MGNNFFLHFQKPWSNWRKNPDWILCLAVHCENFAEILRLTIPKEDSLGKHCDFGKQRAVLCARSWLEEDQEVGRARDSAAEQQEGRGLHQGGIGVWWAVHKRGMLGSRTRPVSELWKLRVQQHLSTGLWPRVRLLVKHRERLKFVLFV